MSSRRGRHTGRGSAGLLVSLCPRCFPPPSRLPTPACSSGPHWRSTFWKGNCRFAKAAYRKATSACRHRAGKEGASARARYVGRTAACPRDATHATAEQRPHPRQRGLLSAPPALVFSQCFPRRIPPVSRESMDGRVGASRGSRLEALVERSACCSSTCCSAIPVGRRSSPG